MATRSESVFENTSVTLFQPLPQSLEALEKTTIEKILNEIPDYSVILAKLQEQGLFLDKTSSDFTIKQFIKKYFAEVSSILQSSSFELLTQPLRNLIQSMLAPSDAYPLELVEYALFPRVDCYIDLLNDVLENTLAQKPYEQLSDRENVTEREHGLQAGKIAVLLGMPLDDTLALLFHDIARPSVDDPKHADQHHALEGGVILSPLGLSIDYSSSHAFAKYILHTFSSSYRELISSTSLRTLALQSKDLPSQLGDLGSLDGDELAVAIYKIVLMRVIDDNSKAPTSELTKRLDGKDPVYFNHQQIREMLHKQMAINLFRITQKDGNKDEIIQQFEEQLNASILLLLRAEKYSLHPDIYKMHPTVIEELLPNDAKLTSS